MRKINAILEEELDDLLDYDIWIFDKFFPLATKFIELYEKRGRKWLESESELESQGMTPQQIDDYAEKFFDEYKPIEDALVRYIKEEMIEELKKEDK